MTSPRFYSALEGIAFPGIPDSNGALLGALLLQMDSSQWWPRDKLIRRQRTQLDALLRHAWHTVPHQRRRLAAAGYDPSTPLDEDVWSRLPLLHRTAVQEAGDRLASKAPPKAHGALHLVQTSGSTGRPVRVRKTGLTRLFWRTITLRDHLWHARDLQAPLAAIRPDRNIAADGERVETWGVSDGLFLSAPCHALNSRTDIGRQWAWLKDAEPAYLVSLPSNIRALARLAAGRGERLSNLRQVCSFGEMVSPDLRAEVRAAFGVPLIDMYSAQEVGYMALQCPDHDHYHVQSEVVRLEVLADDGRPCGPGEVGRIVATPLHNFAYPLIRYVLNDYAEVGGGCPCGRGLPVLKRIVGRARNMAVTPDGRRFWPSFPTAAWTPVAPIRQIRLIQTTPEQVEVHYAMDRELTEVQAGRLAASLQESLGYAFAFSFHRVDDIPAGANGKYEDFVSRLD